MSENPAPVRETTLRFLTQTSDSNFGGKVHGGHVMKWIDEAAYVVASGWSGRYCVTVYVGGIRFYEPVHIGHMVEVHARLIYTGNTSMHIAVDVRSGDPRTRAMTKTTHCIIVFVALDEQQEKPVSVPKWLPQTEEDRREEAYALRLMELRKGIETEMQPYMKPDTR